MDYKSIVIVLLIVFVVIMYFYHISSLKRTRKNVSHMLEAIDNRDFTFRFITKWRRSPDAILNASLNRIVEVVGDINSEIRQREQYFERVINVVDTGILVIDKRDFILQSNEAIFHLLNMKVLTHMEQLSRVDPELPAKLRSLSIGDRFIVPVSTGNGKHSLSVQVTNTILKGQKVRVFVFNDIQRELDNKEVESWERLSRVLTHEIMNSVTPLTSLADTLISKGVAATPDVEQGLLTISRTGKGLIEFVENYRKFAHVPKPNPSLFYVRPFLQQMCDLAEHQVPDSSIIIDLSVEPQDLLVYADEGLISRVVINILKNALQAVESIGDMGKVMVSAICNAEEQVVITISNNGPMIPAEEEEQIFVPFFTTKPNGSGIGLSLSRRIMKESNGELSLHTDRKKGITSFVLLFS
ncbi:MAG: ATP-binding protein [Bacteroidales bacterium]|nr:ATP-binding protein [Bacteroidales bacterium]